MEKKRYHLLDEIRGFAVLCMVVFHGFFSVMMVFGSSLAYDLIQFFLPAEPIFAAAFIFISGVCSTLSRSNAKNGLKLLAVALGVTAVTVAGTELFGMEMSIYFGVIHLLAVCLFAAALLERVKIPCPAVCAAALGIIFLVVYEFVFKKPILPYLGPSSFGITPEFTFSEGAVNMILGLRVPRYFMADYFPILPWVFLFLAGRCAALVKGKGNLPAVFEKRVIPPLGFIGRRALLIYIVHQPVIFGLCYLIKLIIGG